MAIIKQLKKYAALYIGVIVIYMAALLLVYAIPNSAVAENVKANSTLDVADKVMDALVDANLIEKSACKRPNWHKIDVNEVNIVARDIAKARQYPLPMAKVNQRLIV